jgi:hypothetical protein
MFCMGTTMLTLSEAHRVTGLHKSRLSNDIKKGKLSADKEGNRYLIQESELCRVYNLSEKDFKGDHSGDRVTERSENPEENEKEHLDVLSQLAIQKQENKRLVEKVSMMEDHHRQIVETLEKTIQRLEQERSDWVETCKRSQLLIEYHQNKSDKRSTKGKSKKKGKGKKKK